MILSTLSGASVEREREQQAREQSMPRRWSSEKSAAGTLVIYFLV
jgi:hypothetical protein